MAEYIVVNHHEAEECDLMEAGLNRVPSHLQGKDFYCPCPYGVHTFYMVVEGDTAGQVIAGLPSEWRKGSQAYQIETFHL